jgi:hypothetical protein
MRLVLKFFVLTSVVAVSTSGCGSKSDLVPVSGHVTIDGKPVTVGQIAVFPEGRRQSIGKLDSQGKFSLACRDPRDGAPIGQHIATITAVQGIDEHSQRWHAPRKYADKASGVWVKIDGPTEDLKVELTWAGSNHSAPYIEKF